jgi:NAD(P)-dependent dehydrogenase (short-subunit alcohol dehydrogenase family)
VSKPSRVVVVTGASGGIGRACARAFAVRGDKVALLARGSTGLEEARRDVERLGGTPLVIPTDVAEHAQVADAAVRVEEALGDIDVWVNVAFTSVFARFVDIEP